MARISMICIIPSNAWYSLCMKCRHHHLHHAWDDRSGIVWNACHAYHAQRHSCMFWSMHIMQFVQIMHVMHKRITYSAWCSSFIKCIMHKFHCTWYAWQAFHAESCIILSMMCDDADISCITHYATNALHACLASHASLLYNACCCVWHACIMHIMYHEYHK